MSLGVEVPTSSKDTQEKEKQVTPARSKCLVKAILTKKWRKYSPNASDLTAGGICSR
jgi:hypothetical protein